MITVLISCGAHIQASNQTHKGGEAVKMTKEQELAIQRTADKVFGMTFIQNGDISAAISETFGNIPQPPNVSQTIMARVRAMRRAGKQAQI